MNAHLLSTKTVFGLAIANNAMAIQTTINLSAVFGGECSAGHYFWRDAGDNGLYVTDCGKNTTICLDIMPKDWFFAFKSV